MRKILCLFFIVSAAMLFGGASCEGNPISSVGVTANPDGTFGVNATLKNGQVLRYARVSQQWIDTMQARYPNVRAVYYDAPRYVESRSVCPDARAALIASFAEIQAVQNRELAIVEVVQLKPSLARRTRNFFAGRPILSFKGERQCQCGATPASPLIDFTPGPVELPPAANPPSTNDDPVFGDISPAAKRAAVDRIAVLESQMKSVVEALARIEAKVK